MKWTKDNGDVIETNDAPDTIAYCESLGWKPKKKAAPKKKKAKAE